MTDNALTDKAAFTYQLRGAFRAYEIALGRYLQSFDLPLSHFYVFQIPWLEGGHSQKHLGLFICRALYFDEKPTPAFGAYLRALN